MTYRCRIDFSFDFVCPWCLIAKRQLDIALNLLRTQQPEIKVDVRFHGMQLLPDVPSQGLPFADFYRRRLGSAEAVQARQAEVREVALGVGLDLDLMSIARMPNTTKAHQLFKACAQGNTSAQLDPLLDRLFAAYFMRGEDLGDSATLCAIAKEYGYDTNSFASCLNDPSVSFASDFFNTGSVPVFLFNQQLQLTGAHSPDVLFTAIIQAAASGISA